MKKGLILILTFLLIFAFGSLTIAKKSQNIEEQNLNKSLKVGVHLDPYAIIDTNPANLNYDAIPRPDYENDIEGHTINLSSPSNPDANAVGFPIKIKVNTAFVLKVQETVSKEIADELKRKGVDPKLVRAFDKRNGTGDNWIIAPNVEVFIPKEGDPTGQSGWSQHPENMLATDYARTVTEQGVKDRVMFPTDIREFNGIIQFNAHFKEESFNLKNSFKDVKSKEYTGEIIITVEANGLIG